MRNFFTAAIVAASMLFAASSAQAQVKFGLKGGLNVTNMSLNSEVFDADNQTGFFIGPTVKFTLPIVGLGIDASALYDQRDAKVKVEDDGESVESKIKNQSINIPINLRYGVGLGSTASLFLFAGPQFGFYMSDKTDTNFDVRKMPATDNDRVSPVVAQDTMAVKNKLDYGIALGLGAEYSIPKVGHFLVEARYYYGLGNIYGSSKRDYFGKSNYGQIVIKASYLFDITRTKNVKRK